MSPKKPTIEILKLRLLVGLLGESQPEKWWASSFYSQSSDAFLQPVFPRTAFLAKYHGIKEAAMLVHDEHIGVGQVFHLYRLTEALEKELHDLAQDEEVIAKFKDLLFDPTTASNALDAMAGAEIWTSEGPLRAGTLDDLTRKMSWQDVAYHYATAFKNDTKVYPYFTSQT